MNENDLMRLNKELEGMTLAESLTFVSAAFKGRKVFSTSFGIEDQLLTHFIAPLGNKVEVFTLDTGRQFNETYEVWQKTLSKYPGLTVKAYFPDADDIKEYVNANGINGFYDSIEQRKSCCYLRKVKPLQKAVSGAALWITGLRAEQSPNRTDMKFLEWDEANQLVKFNPLLHFNLKQVEDAVSCYNIPINTLYKHGFVSIGCAPCTRAVQPGEDFRAGRWWWENGKKECGLHIHSDKNY